jgi:hypothetical protein
MSRPNPLVDIARFLDTGAELATVSNGAGGARTVITVEAHGLAPGDDVRISSAVAAINGSATVGTVINATTFVTSETYEDAALVTGDGRLHKLPLATDARSLGANLFYGPDAPGPEGESVPSSLPDSVVFVSVSGGPAPVGTANRGFGIFEAEYSVTSRSNRVAGDVDEYAVNEARGIALVDALWRGKPEGYMRTGSYVSHPEYEGLDSESRHVHSVRGYAWYSYTTE